MPRAIIIHCWEGYPDYCWYPWVKKQLEAKGFEVKVPAFPNTANPKLSEWLPYLAEQIGEPGEDLYLIGHSLGRITIMRYLESLPEGKRIGGIVFVAGFTEELEYEQIMNFFRTPVDFQKIKTRVKNGFVAIHSDDDPYVDLKFGDIFKGELNTKLIVKHNMGHFSGSVENETSCRELPDVVESIEKMMT